MLIKTVLNRLTHFKSFVFGNVFFDKVKGEEAVVVEIFSRKKSRPVCPECGRKGPGYDVQPARTFQYLPLFEFKVFFLYALRRVNCPLHGIHVEALPWGSGKEHLTNDYKLFLGRWARRLSWSETARVFRTSWDSVFRAVSFMVDYGLKHRSLEGVTQQLNIQSVKAYLLREDFQRFWEFKNASVAGRFLDSWCKRTMRTKLEPMKKVAKMLQNHKPLIMNWFEAKGTLSSGAVEGLNHKAKLTMRKAFGFRSTDSLKIALYHTLGKLPDPPGTHGFS